MTILSSRSQQLLSYYKASRHPEIVFQDDAQYISLPGAGDPSENTFAEKIQALYSTAYAIKYIFRSRGRDFKVPKLECLWWFDKQKFRITSMAEAPLLIPRSEWAYRLLLRMPPFVTEDEMMTAIEIVHFRKRLSEARNIRFFEQEGGSFVQVLHTGPFEQEHETLRTLETFIQRKQLQLIGTHHEIYLSDFRRTATEKLRTILRERIA